MPTLLVDPPEQPGTIEPPRKLWTRAECEMLEAASLPCDVGTGDNSINEPVPDIVVLKREFSLLFPLIPDPPTCFSSLKSRTPPAHSI